jgi:probable LLM family oxidoreductase
MVRWLVGQDNLFLPVALERDFMEPSLDLTRPTDSGIEIGVITLGEFLKDPFNDKKISAQQRIKEIIDAARLADEAGLDVFGIGEHHALDFVVSAVPVVLAAIAQVTKRIRLTSAVTVLSTADPVREFENFATLDLLSVGRAEMMVGRGAFIESFSLFGYDLNDFDALFPEKLDLLLKLNTAEKVTWPAGRFRAGLVDAEIAPRPLHGQLPVWVAVGGTPQSAMRAATLGLPMILGIIGGASAQFKPLMELYHRTGIEANQPLGRLKTGVTSYMHIAKTSQQAIEEFYPYHTHYFGQLGRSRGRLMQLSRTDYERAASLEGAYFVGSPQQIIDKLLYQHSMFGHQRFMAQIDIGGLPFDKVAQTIELLATQVAPVVRRETTSQPSILPAEREKQ